MKTYGLGATYLGGRVCAFCVWAPLVQKVELRLLSAQERIFPLEEAEHGYHQAVVEGIEPKGQYLYRLDGQKDRPDPASRFQPKGVHGPSEILNPVFPWEDQTWSGLPLRDYIIYELHVGTFTADGTFEAIMSHLDELKDLGVTALELMPVAQFPGERNWGYDGVYPFAVQNSYGGPEGLKRLVNACHKKGLAVVLDVVYNHLGPEGNYLWDFGPYFTDKYRTPWGASLNFDGPHSDEVRRYFIENALYWITEFHIDALRIDAVHAILDFSAQPFLEELGVAVHEHAERLDRQVHLIPESALNDTRIIRTHEFGGFGLDAQWNDDFHHALHALLTREQMGYYQDFQGLAHLAKAFREGFVYSGQYSPYRKRKHGNSSVDIPPHRFVVFSQNHDQVGNRMLGERLSNLVSFEGLKLAAGVVLLSPFIPLLFMGEEYGETAPFPYFISHLDADLVEAVRKGRKEEFSSFQWKGELPDPQDSAAFLSAKLNHLLKKEDEHQTLFELYRELIRLRRETPALAQLSKEHMEVVGLEKEGVLVVRRWTETVQTVAIFHFGQERKSVVVLLPEGIWTKQFDSASEKWRGPGGQLPDKITSTERVVIDLAPSGCLLLVQKKES